MVIRIKINDKDFSQFAQKTVEQGLTPIDIIESIIIKSLNERNLKSSILNKEKPKNHTEELFVDFEHKMKKYNIHQSSIAHYLQTTQASISRSLKSKKNNTLLFNKMNELKDKILINAYTYQFGYEFNIEKSLSEEIYLFLSALAGKIKLLNYNYSIGLSIEKDYESLQNFILFNKVDLKAICIDIDNFVSKVDKLAQEFISINKN